MRVQLTLAESSNFISEEEFKKWKKERMPEAIKEILNTEWTCFEELIGECDGSCKSDDAPFLNTLEFKMINGKLVVIITQEMEEEE